jgi:hypothetical protein
MELDMTAAEMLTVLSDILTKQIMTSRNKKKLILEREEMLLELGRSYHA